MSSGRMLVTHFKGILNDLWSFNTSFNKWTFIVGSNISSSYGNYGAPGVCSLGNVPSSRYGSMCWMDKTGKFWVFGGLGTQGRNFIEKVNPRTFKRFLVL